MTKITHFFWFWSFSVSQFIWFSYLLGLFRDSLFFFFEMYFGIFFSKASFLWITFSAFICFWESYIFRTKLFLNIFPTNALLETLFSSSLLYLCYTFLSQMVFFPFLEFHFFGPNFLGTRKVSFISEFIYYHQLKLWNSPPGKLRRR